MCLIMIPKVKSKSWCATEVLCLVAVPAAFFGTLTRADEDVFDASKRRSSPPPTTATPRADTDLHSNHVTSNVAQASANFFTDIGPPSFSSRTFQPPEYESLFDSLPSLPYFPDFGEIFRIQRTTTPKPPFRFPDYVRDAFPERPPESPVNPIAGRGGDSEDSVIGGRRPSRRLPRPASSGTKAKLVKQNQSEVKEKLKPGKNKTPTKARDYPKIFRFTADRVNLADFDMRKKMNGNYVDLAKGDELDSSKIQRSKFLILHGGVFKMDRPMSNGIYAENSDVVPVTESIDRVGEYGTRNEKSNDSDSLPYYHES